jgi:hypothetical protein
MKQRPVFTWKGVFLLLAVVGAGCGAAADDEVPAGVSARADVVAIDFDIKVVDRKTGAALHGFVGFVDGSSNDRILLGETDDKGEWKGVARIDAAARGYLHVTQYPTLTQTLQKKGCFGAGPHISGMDRVLRLTIPIGCLPKKK